MKDLISVIIPAYNAAGHIGRCLDSIIAQTYDKFELIVIDDGSTDNTVKAIEKYGKKDKRISVHSIENGGQGNARNIGLKKAKGKYIMFVDSDDTLEKLTFELCIKKFNKENPDFVHMDWKYYFYETEKMNYISQETFFHKRNLVGKECEELINVKNYFSVCNMYKRKFLLDNNIKYDKEYLYEDYVFCLKTGLYAKKIGLIHSPLYIVGVSDFSSTKTNHETDRHAVAFIKAYDSCMKAMNEANGSSQARMYLINYMLRKFMLYYSKRVPRKYKKKFLADFYSRISKEKIELKYIPNTYVRMGIKYGILKNKALFLIYFNLMPVKNFLVKSKRKTRWFLRRIKRIFSRESYLRTLNIKCSKKYEEEELKNVILFMGFDFRYTGNSRYLFEDMLKEKNIEMYFVTDNELVNPKYRVSKGTKKFYELLYSSKVVIFESWIAPSFRKNENSIWINLWHGTPLKKMLFDSEEKYITESKPKHKLVKFHSIRKMDYLLTDSKEINKYFNSSFLLPDERLLAYGYPRVKYLIDNINNEKLKKELRKELNISEDKKIVMYLPTWRDYNFEEQDPDYYDFSYQLDKEKLSKYLGTDYIIVSKDHVYKANNKAIASTDMETQELLLVSDYLVTDYSSVMFDAFPIDLPVCIFANDYEKYDEARGVYEDMWEDLKPIVRDNEKDVAEMIKTYKIDKTYKNLNKKYGYKSEGDLVKFITKLIKQK